MFGSSFCQDFWGVWPDEALETNRSDSEWSVVGLSEELCFKVDSSIGFDVLWNDFYFTNLSCVFCQIYVLIASTIEILKTEFRNFFHAAVSEIFN